MEYLIREAKITDANDILTLHKKYLYQNLPEKEKRLGFVKVEYSIEDIKRIIKENEIIICYYGNSIIGYYLLGFVTKNKSLDYQYKALQELTYNGYLLKDLKVACGAQAIVEKEFRGLGLVDKMLQLLIKNVRSKYDYLMSSITRSNENASKVHEKSGYNIIGETDSRVFVCLKINL